MKRNEYNFTVVLMTLVVVILGLSSTVLAKKNTVPEPFRGQDNQSTIRISYDDYSELLQLSVLDMGKSSRAKSPKNTAKIGTRVKAKRKTIYTALEGNRFLFDNFKDQKSKMVLTTIRKSLEQVPDEVPMAMLNAREQLAFWLNLYNITLIEQLIELHLANNIEDELYGSKGIMKKKLLEVSGIKLSLNDIHYKIILGKFSANPLVIYGLFQGTIGGPNIRTAAYDGKQVISQLRQNASIFINSNRGTFKGKKKTLRVSSFYDLNSSLFPNFNKDLKKHLHYYIDDNFTDFLEDSTKLKANIEAMNIVDITGGQRDFSSSSATNQAALLGSASAQGLQQTYPDQREGSTEGFADPSMGLKSSAYRSLTVDFGRFSPQQVKLLQALQKNRKEKSGKVIITDEEEFDDS